ncbi:hypothetical protein AKJ16_DCAP26378 [Drosera capensis]
MEGTPFVLPMMKINSVLDRQQEEVLPSDKKNTSNNGYHGVRNQASTTNTSIDALPTGQAAVNQNSHQQSPSRAEVRSGKRKASRISSIPTWQRLPRLSPWEGDLHEHLTKTLKAIKELKKIHDPLRHPVYQAAAVLHTLPPYGRFLVHQTK